MKTLADLKKDAKSGKLSAEMIIRCGSNEIIERLQGRRKIVDANTVGIFFQNKDGKKSELPLPYASLVEYDGNTIKVYRPGFRDLNATEQSALDEWNKIAETEKYKEQAANDMMTDGSQTYWQEKAFFEKRNLKYLMSCSPENGLRYIAKDSKIQDKAIKGEIDFLYNVYND